MSLPPLPPQPPMPSDQKVTATLGDRVMEHVTGLVATLDRRFDTSHSDLKEYIAQRFIDTDLRYQQRFDAQTKALDAALAAQKEAVQTALVAAEKATMKAEQASEKRFDSVNAFRETLTDQTATFIPRSEAEARLNSISEKVDDLKLGATTTAGRSSGLQSGWGYLLAGVSVIVLVVNFAIALATH